MQAGRWFLAASTVPLILLTGLAWADIAGSKHDFSDQPWSDGDTCVACHIPHREELPTAAPMWDPTADLSRTFGTPLVQSQMAGEGTNLCLRCHDGTVARDTVPAAARRSRFPHRHHPGLFATGHGTSDHPVGVPYPNVDKGYHPIPTVLSHQTVVLPNGMVECISCHDPHDQSGWPHMLVTSNARSALCLTCHKK